MIFGHHGKSLDPLFSSDGKEETATQINLSIEWNQNGERVMLDIAHPFISELVANRDVRLFELMSELTDFGLSEIKETLEAERQEWRSKIQVEVPPDRPGYVYLVKSGDGYYKIGRSKNVKVRMRDFGLQLPFPFEVIHTIPAKDMYRSEDNLHKRFAHCRLNGEWFSLTKEDVAAISSIEEL